MDKTKWNSGILDEVNFWESWFATKGLEWPDDYKFRLDPSTELQSYIKDLLVGKENPTILDIGAGPLTFLGKNIDGFPINIYPVDALAANYNIIMHQHGIVPPIRTIYKESEDIDQLIGLVKPDLIVAQNTLDHSYNPMKAIALMTAVVNPRGVIYLNHYSRTADNEQHLGLHQWNFYLENDRLMLASDGVTYDVIAEIMEYNPQLRFTWTNSFIPDSNQIVTIIRLV